MIRTSRIPPILSRICDENITSAYFLTSDGELLGCYSSLSPNNQSANNEDEDGVSQPQNQKKQLNASSIGALVSEVAEDYRRIGKGMGVQQNHPSGGGAQGLDLNCLLIEMELGLVGVANAGPECFVVAIAANKNVELGLLKAKLLALAGYVRESLTQLTAPQL